MTDPPGDPQPRPHAGPQAELRAWENVLSGDLDAWFQTAHDAPDPGVREAAGTAIAALAALRVAMDSLARAQTPPASSAFPASSPRRTTV